MALTITASFSGSLVAQAQAAKDDLGKAVTVAITAATEGAKLELRQQLARGARMDKFRNAIRSAVYPKPPRFSANAAGTVFAAGDDAERAFSAFSTGAVVLPNKKKALAIPLHNYRGADGKLLGPNSSYFAGRLRFLPSRERGASVPVGILATRAVGRPSEIRKQLKSKGRAAIAEGLQGQWIPQFILVRAAKLPKLMSPEDVLAKWAGQLPDLTTQALDALKA